MTAVDFTREGPWRNAGLVRNLEGLSIVTSAAPLLRHQSLPVRIH